MQQLDHVNRESHLARRLGTVLAVLTIALGLTLSSAPAWSDDGGGALDNAMLAAKVRLAMLSDLGVDSLHVGVDADGGVVHLTGTVNHRKTRELADEIVADVDGVTSVDNDISLEKSAGEGDAPVAGALEEAERETRDGILETKVKIKLMSEIGTNAMDVEVEASDGTVRLSGTTDSDSVADSAVKVAKSVDGVKDVIDDVHGAS